ncbi:MAG: preprotein translocase subunit YajC [Gemmatimonadetes bacterium]|nr:preprotein translocase subunit YajC [Gemmatimonadota bacterium]
MLHALFLFAPAGQQTDGRMMGAFVIQMVLIVAIVYFLLIRPKMQQEKRHRERIAHLKRGDEIVTAGGIIGEVVHLKDDRITVKSGEARLVIQRDRITEIRGAGGAVESASPSKRAAADSGTSGATVS